MDPAPFERMDLSSPALNRLRDIVVRNAIMIGLSNSSIIQLKVLIGSKKGAAETILRDFVQENCTQLDQISHIFQKSQAFLLSDLSMEGEKCIKILYKLAVSIIAEAAKVKSRDLKKDLLTSFQDETSKSYIILQVMKKLTCLNSQEGLRILLADRSGAFLVGLHFKEFLSQYKESLGEQNDLTLAFRIFLKRSLQDCYSLKPEVAEKQMLIMQQYLVNHKELISLIAKRSFKSKTESLFKIEQSDRKTAELLNHLFGDAGFKDTVKTANLMLDLIEEGNTKFLQLVDSQNFWDVCHKTISMLNMRPSYLMDRDQPKLIAIQQENALQSLIMWGIFHIPKMDNSVDSELVCWKWALIRLFSSDTFPQALVECLLDQKFLEILPLFPEILSSLINHPDIPENIKRKILNINREIVDSCHFLQQFFDSMSFVEQNFHLLAADQHLQVLRAKKYPYVVWFENKMHQLDEKSREFQFKVEEIKKKNSQLTHKEYELLKEDALVREDPDLIICLETRGLFASKIHKKRQVDLVTYCLMLDKVIDNKLVKYLFDRPLEFFAQALIETINRVHKNKNQWHLKEILPSVDILKNQYVPILEQFIILVFLRDSNKDLYIQYIVKNLSQMKLHDKMLIPIGCMQHAAGLLVTKSKRGFFQLTIYNTGLGVNVWHPQFPNSDRFQTFLEIDDVPELSLTKEDIWLFLIKHQMHGANMNAIYEKLISLGNLLDPSSHEAYFEAKQHEGTCAMQFLMAFEREQFMKIAPGTAEEKEAAYKILKANQFHRYRMDHAKEVDPNIQECCTSVFKKISAEMHMVEIAKNEADFNRFIDKMASVFVEFKAKDTFDTLIRRTVNTNLGRFATLRAASTALCMIFVKRDFPIVQNKHKKVLKLVTAKFEHQQIIISKWTTRLESLYNQKNNRVQMSELIINVALFTAYPHLAMKYAVMFFKDQDFKVIQEFLHRAANYRSQMNAFVEEFADRIQIDGRNELADQIRNYWVLEKE